MAEITRYEVGCYGGPGGHRGQRARILLYDDASCLGYVSFLLPGEPIPEDGDEDDRVRMHLPDSMLGPVMDLLRNEGPVIFEFSAGVGVLRTWLEPAGEGEE